MSISIPFYVTEAHAGGQGVVPQLAEFGGRLLRQGSRDLRWCDERVPVGWGSPESALKKYDELSWNPLKNHWNQWKSVEIRAFWSPLGVHLGGKIPRAAGTLGGSQLQILTACRSGRATGLTPTGTGANVACAAELGPGEHLRALRCLSWSRQEEECAEDN